MQLYDQMLVRHGIMLVGPSGGGKTVARNILHKALSLLPIFNEKANPKQNIDSEKQKSHNTMVKFNLNNN
jgi:dynein heavy chain